MNTDWRVIGVGTPHGDDAVGLRAIERLRRRLTDDRVRLQVARSGSQLLDLIEPDGKLILIDGIRTGSTPVGSLHRLPWPDARMRFTSGTSTHSFGIVEALEMAAAVGMLPTTVLVFGIEIGRCEPHGEPHPRLETGLEDLAAAVNEELNRR